MEFMELKYLTKQFSMDEKGLIICDGKRNDIGSTAEAYSSAFLGELK